MAEQKDTANIAIIGAGILGTALAYILSSLSNVRIILLEQEKRVGAHTSSRNTGKVHAPFIYNPLKKKIFAKASLYGYNFWKEYCNAKDILFKEDGVIEVAAANSNRDIETVYKHYDWGLRNGLEKNEIKILDRKEMEKVEPNVRCQAAILCTKDASVDYGEITASLAVEASKNNVRTITAAKVTEIREVKRDGMLRLKYRNQEVGDEKGIECDFLINSAGGNSLGIVNKMGISHTYRDLYFRGEYWIAPPKYKDLTKHSIYSTPQFSQFPFLDPHWIIRSNGNREIGPNACPVFSPYGYNNLTNIREFFPKMYQIIRGSNLSAKNRLLKKDILEMLSKETLSSLSKHYMIKRVKKFLPLLDSRDFTSRGISGIRSNLIDKNGEFILNPIFMFTHNSLHILNYNSPGATGALSVGFSIVFKLIEKGIINRNKENRTPFKETIILDCIRDVDLNFL
ncbi:MAG: FAD-dependent oxidoreductase [Thermoproteota archaeon]|nr:FAD-dependent oxidoreductase [Thermoproteota archaeon]